MCAALYWAGWWRRELSHVSLWSAANWCLQLTVCLDFYNFWICLFHTRSKKKVYSHARWSSSYGNHLLSNGLLFLNPSILKYFLLDWKPIYPIVRYSKLPLFRWPIAPKIPTTNRSTWPIIMRKDVIRPSQVLMKTWPYRLASYLWPPLVVLNKFRHEDWD